MPPSNPPPFDPKDHLLSEHNKQSGSAGPVIGIVIIVAVLILGGLYFWGAHLNNQNQQNNLPLIPADSSAASTP